MTCPGCERLRKELEEQRDLMQLKEFELAEKLNLLEDKLEWAGQDEENLKDELRAVKKELERYKAIVANLGLSENELQVKTPSGDESSGVGPPAGSHVKRLLEIIKAQSELLEEMKGILAADLQNSN